MARIILKLPGQKAFEFQHFIARHAKVESWQQMENHFLLKLVPMEEEEFLAFFKGLEEIFQVTDFRSLCHAKCRDDTDCLNTAIGGFCWKHKRKK